MTIPLIKEPDDNPWGDLVESCHFCHERTRYWHENTNNPVCRECAKTHKVAELPDHGRNVRALKRKRRQEQKANET